MKGLSEAVGLPHHIVTACVNALLRSKDAVKNSVKVSTEQHRHEEYTC